MKAIKDLIARNKLEEASMRLRSLDLNPEIEKEIILLTSRFYELIEKGRIGLISPENANVERSKIVLGFLYIIEKVDKENLIVNSKKVKLPVNIDRYKIDDRIRTSLERIHDKQIDLNQKFVSADFLINELYNLFDRMTFIREPKIETCRSQRWSARVHSAKMTYEILINFQNNIYKEGTIEQAGIYGELLSNIGKYIDSMIGMLFKLKKVEIDEIYDLIGTSDFLVKFRENEEIKFPPNESDETIIMEDRIKTTINKYLGNTITNIQDLLKTTK